MIQLILEMARRECKRDNNNDCMYKNSNCSYLGRYGEIVQCILNWAEYEYDYLDRYLSSSGKVYMKT